MKKQKEMLRIVTHGELEHVNLLHMMMTHDNDDDDDDDDDDSLSYTSVIIYTSSLNISFTLILYSTHKITNNKNRFCAYVEKREAIK